MIFWRISNSEYSFDSFCMKTSQIEGFLMKIKYKPTNAILKNVANSHKRPQTMHNIDLQSILEYWYCYEKIHFLSPIWCRHLFN